ncbi:xylose operon transcription regulator XylR [Blastopirellula marina]|uniref:AraC family transcriptional regulator n=1 Tax=Blastopirellula marina TaxID=124 RepID=A0A2S8G9F7_9BACT|nr:xylose operon transcription regulator XylR [Blastopirellula marina]PQO41096.1 AraC family transcriptional regulator [Blastopirellula marina]PTL45972.1 AraC family transcriptional regulator [Blastopirellula marina]
MSNQIIRRVAVLIETDDTWGRSVVRAIGKYASENHWRLLIAPRDAQQRLRLPRRWQGDGVITHMRTRTLVTHLRRAGLPTVDVSIMFPGENWVGRVITDDQVRSQMAVNHFRERGIEHFACYAPQMGRYSPQREELFAQAVRDAGYTCETFRAKGVREGWSIEPAPVINWLSKLKRPLGLFASDPYPARQIAEICETAGLRIPDEIAILAGDDDDLICNLGFPSLSAVQLACTTLGKTAAGLLTQLMEGEPIPAEPIKIPPLQVCPRHSTDLLAINDPELQAILRYIHENVDQGIQVKQVLRKFAISRRNLEQRFRAELGRSPAELIRGLRLDMAKRLLIETDLSIAEASRMCGFTSKAHFSVSFHQQFGSPPSTWRMQFAQR